MTHIEKIARDAAKRSLAMQDSRSRRYRPTAKSSAQADRQRGDPSMGSMGRSSKPVGSPRYHWNPTPVPKI